MPERFVYKRLTAEQFRGGLYDIDMQPKAFARIFGVNVKTVTRWTRGEQDVPPWVTVALELLKVPGAMGHARMTAAGMIEFDKLNPKRGQWPYMDTRTLPEDFVDDED